MFPKRKQPFTTPKVKVDTGCKLLASEQQDQQVQVTTVSSEADKMIADTDRDYFSTSRTVKETTES